MTDRFRRACLVSAVIIGCACSAFQILHDVRVPVQLLPGVAARVNGRPIDSDSVNRTVAGMDARVRRSEAAARHSVLGRMIDEELLVQHALDSGAAETNPEVRAALVRSAITRVNSEAAAEPVSEAELSAYFDAHKEVYATAAGFDVTPLYFAAESGQAGATRAEAARAALEAGTPVEQVVATADPSPFRSPGSQVSPRTLANYFGPALADAVGRIATGHTTEVMPSVASIHDLVAADALRDRQEHALEGLLASLRQSAHIEFATSPNPAPPVAASR
jgi:hypothetical protein